MTKRFAKLFSLALAVLMLVSIASVGAFAYTSEYITIDCPENFDEEDYSTEDGFYVDVYYSEYALNENNEEYYTDNTVNVYAEACWDDTLDLYYDDETLEALVELTEDFGGKVESQTMYYTTIGGLDAVAYDVYYTYTGADESGKRVVEDWLFSEVIIVKDRICITIDLDICEADDLLASRNEMAVLFLKNISINTEKVAEAEKGEKIIALVVLLALAGGIVAVIVAVVKSSKKKNAPIYPYNNNVPPQYYNPYGQMPYGQVPYGNQQNSTSAPTTPSYVVPPVAKENNENNTENLDS